MPKDTLKAYRDAQDGRGGRRMTASAAKVPGAKWWKESTNYKIMRVTSEEACATYGKLTKWCKDIIQGQGAVYIVFRKKNSFGVFL